MEYQPLGIDHNSTLPEPYLNDVGGFVTLPSKDQVIEFLLNEATEYIVWKHGGEYAKDLIIYPENQEFNTTYPEGHIICVRDDGHGYTVKINYLEKGWTYSQMISEPVYHFIYITNNRNITLPQITKDEKKNELLYNYSNVIDELSKFDKASLRPVIFENEIEIDYDSGSDWEYTSSSSSSELIYEDSSSSEFNEDDFEYSRIPTPPPAPKY